MRCVLAATITAAAAGMASAAAIAVHIESNKPVQPSMDPRLVGIGWETDSFLRSVGLAGDPAFLHAASALAPGWLRVGGISADWVRYTNLTSSQGKLGGWWPSSDTDFSGEALRALFRLTNATGLDLILDLNELEGRDCHTGPYNITCTGHWNTSNVASLLRWLHDEPELVRSGRLRAVELGNEITRSGHLTMPQQIADYKELRSLLADVFGADGPALTGPSTDVCDATSLAFMRGTSPWLAGFNYHSYPAQGCQSDADYFGRVLSPAWLRRGVWQRDAHANASECAVQWRASGLAGRGVPLRLTETNACYSPPPNASMASFSNAFFTIASVGQIAQAGVSMRGRWSMVGGGGFSLLTPVEGAGPLTAVDYWVSVLHKRTVGHGPVLNATVAGDDDTPVLAYAHCAGAAYARGAVALLLLNTDASTPATVALSGVASTSPRLEWVLTAAPRDGEDPRYTNRTRLNGGVPLVLDNDGRLPPLPPRPVAGGGPEAVTLPPFAVAFIVLDAAAAPACA